MSNNSFYVETALSYLGESLKVARRRRHISTKLMSERLGVTRVTLGKMEKGDGGVSVQVYALALFILSPNKLDEWTAVLSEDTFGQTLLEGSIPQRIRGKNKL